jgi:predicted nuclease of predicted toxin-antitoxin system
VSELKFKIDENLPVEAAKIFLKLGYDADTIFAEGLKGSSDEELINVCKKEDRILVTLDLDFSDVRVYPPGSVPGIIILRIADQSADSTLSVLNKVILAVNKENPAGKLWIVDEKRIRIRESE